MQIVPRKLIPCYSFNNATKDVNIKSDSLSIENKWNQTPLSPRKKKLVTTKGKEKEAKKTRVKKYSKKVTFTS